MKTYLVLFLIAMCSSLMLTPFVRRVCERFGWLDVPRDERRVHRRAVPRLGGVAIFASIIIALCALAFVTNPITKSLAAGSSELIIALVPAAFVFLFGVYDDLRGAPARSKFIAQAAAGALLYAMGGRIETLSVPFVGSLALPSVVGLALTVFWVVGVSNAFNLIDGMDGLAAGAGLFASLVMLVVSLMLGHTLVTVCAIALSGALIGFLRYNFNPASIFLGDSGSLFIGFMLAALSVQGTQKASTVVAVSIPLLAFGLPVVDTCLALARRFLSGRPLFEGDREHIHHMLLARGWSQRHVAFVLYGVCALFGMMALLFVNEADAGRTTGLMLFVVAAAVVLAVGRLRYHEVDEVKASMRRNVTNLAKSRPRAANNIRIRRACRAISEAATLGEVFSAVEGMLRIGEFVYATVQFGSEDPTANARALERERGSDSMRTSELRNGFIYWSWERGDVAASEIIGSGRFWTLRLPLSTRDARQGYFNLYREINSGALLLDMSYLCNLFQREMAHAVERILCAEEETPQADARPLSVRAAQRYSTITT